MHVTKWKSPIWKGCVQYNSNYASFWERQNYGNSEKYTTLVRNDNSGRAMHMLVQVVYEKSLYLALNFPVN